MSFNVKVGGVIFPTNEGILSNNIFDISPYIMKINFIVLSYLFRMEKDPLWIGKESLS